jgi:hypothetical protein
MAHDHSRRLPGAYAKQERPSSETARFESDIATACLRIIYMLANPETSMRRLLFRLIITVALFTAALHGQTTSWKGHQWTLTAGGMAGVAKGDPANIRIDQNGYLHLRIVDRNGTWTASEMFTADSMGFGTYQWVVQGDAYKMDKSTVLGLFSYGPARHLGVDGENEIDIEFSQWNKTCNGCNADFTVYPATGNRKSDGSSSWEENFHIDGGTLTTARMEWRSGEIVFTIMDGVQPIGTTANVIRTKTYSSNAVNIPQAAAPVGINLWSFKALPSKNQQIVIRDFQFVAR